VAKTIDITVYPAAVEAEYLTVSDAMRQVLDYVEALEKAESLEGDERRIVWRLKHAHTNSPPFTVVAQAFPANPAVSVSLEAERVVSVFSAGLMRLLDGQTGDWIDREIAAPLRRAMKRNLNGIGQTDLRIDDGSPLSVTPASAKTALIALERFELDEEAATIDLRRVEYGSIEGEVCGLTKWNDKPALVVIERLSEKKVTCVLSAELAAELGPDHRWSEAWDGRQLLIGGAIYYGSDGFIKRIDATSSEEMKWADVRLSDLKEIDLLQGKRVTEHLRSIWGDDLE
jgi:hypothetical protein